MTPNDLAEKYKLKIESLNKSKSKAEARLSDHQFGSNQEDRCRSQIENIDTEISIYQGILIDLKELD